MPSIVSVAAHAMNKRNGEHSLLAVKTSGLTPSDEPVITLGGSAAGSFEVRKTIKRATDVAGTFWVIGFIKGKSNARGAHTPPGHRHDVGDGDEKIDTDPEITVTVTSGSTPSTPAPVPVVVFSDTTPP